MTIQQQIAKQFRDAYFGGNWTMVDMKETLADVTWQKAIKKVGNFNTIAGLVYHINYYVKILTNVLEGQPLQGGSNDNFAHPPINSQADWEKLLNEVWTDAEKAATLIEHLPESKLAELFGDGKYGTVYRNITGVIEHLYYHMGQITLVKKMVAETK